MHIFQRQTNRGSETAADTSPLLPRSIADELRTTFRAGATGRRSTLRQLPQPAPSTFTFKREVYWVSPDVVEPLGAEERRAVQEAGRGFWPAKFLKSWSAEDLCIKITQLFPEIGDDIVFQVSSADCKNRILKGRNKEA